MCIGRTSNIEPDRPFWGREIEIVDLQGILEILWSDVQPQYGPAR